MNALFAILIAGAFMVLCSYPRSRMVDLRNGSRGVTLLGGILLAQRGQNYQLIQQYCGSRHPYWSVAQVYGGRDGDDRVDSRSIVFSDLFELALRRAPNESVKRAIVDAVTDPDNLARVEQSLVLKCMAIDERPVDHYASAWWREHPEMLTKASNPSSARMVVRRLDHHLVGEFGVNYENLSAEVKRARQAAEYYHSSLWETAEDE